MVLIRFLACWTLAVARLLGFKCEFDGNSEQVPNATPIHVETPYATHDVRQIVVNTWPFVVATEAAWETLTADGSALDAVEVGCTTCEVAQCDGTVGYGGSPDESGETTLDAMIMEGGSMAVGAVANLQHVKAAVSAARLVLERTTHSLLAGLQATKFAQEMGVEISNLTTDNSAAMHKKWKDNNCQPNFRIDVSPNPRQHCGPYHPTNSTSTPSTTATTVKYSHQPQLPSSWASSIAHDTISMIALDQYGDMSVACSTNGAINKIPGRVGDCAVPGAGAYVDSAVGGCGATGDGDVHLRFLPCFQVVASMRAGMSPQTAAEEVVRMIAKRVKGGRYVGAVVAVSNDGRHGAAMYGFDHFSYAYRDEDSDGVQIKQVKPLSLI